MGKRTIVHRLVAGSAVLLVATGMARANVLVDPGYENQTAPASGGWNLFNGAEFSQDVARTGTWSMKHVTSGNVPGAYETFAATPGSQWQLTGYGLTPTVLTGNPGFGIVQVTFFSGPDGTGQNLGTVATSPGNAQASAQINASTPANQWTFLDTGIAVAPTFTQSVQAFTLVVDFNSVAPEGVYFDDVNFVQIPEPASLSLFGLGAAALLGRRRRD